MMPRPSKAMKNSYGQNATYKKISHVKFDGHRQLAMEDRFAFVPVGVDSESSGVWLMDRVTGVKLLCHVNQVFLVLDQVKFILSTRVTYSKYLEGYSADEIGRLTVEFILPAYSNKYFRRCGDTSRNYMFWWNYFIGCYDLKGYHSVVADHKKGGSHYEFHKEDVKRRGGGRVVRGPEVVDGLVT